MVHAGWERKTGRRVAIKVINVDAMGSHEEAIALKREIDVLAANKHPHERWLALVCERIIQKSKI